MYGIDAYIDPPWHHPWPFLGSPMAVPDTSVAEARSRDTESFHPNSRLLSLVDPLDDGRPVERLS